MAEEQSDRGSSFLNANTLFALVTVFGGLWFVSQKLTSNRPVVPAGEARSVYIGEQQVEERLWEDPFKKLEQHKSAETPAGEEVQSKAREFPTNLLNQIRERTTTNPVLILPVMVDGGNFGEDKESRLRARYAIVAALGRSGWAPEDAQHVGAVTIPWLTQHQLEAAVKNTNLFDGEEKNLWSSTNTLALGAEPEADLLVSFEWYRPRTFSPPAKRDVSKILLLWLDENFFDDEPLVRLAMLFEPLLALTNQAPRPQVALVGPRGSDTLRLMIPTKRTKGVSWRHENQPLFDVVRSVLGHVDLYCATPSVFDEAFTDQADPIHPRAAVGKMLVKSDDGGDTAGFKSFQNFAVTGSQLAQALYDELSLRSANVFTNLHNHVALISEWDTYYGRTLTRTYEAQLYAMQANGRGGNYLEEYISLCEKGSNALPANFHSFVYLRGLDGQTIDSEKHDDEGKESRKKPESFEDLRHWEPEANEMYGPAQFDYLTRIGDQLEELEKSLRRKGDGKDRLKAVGIVGSDVYDTLLILQALRRRFDGVHFFTTDLDARFYSPREREWARNLIVVSAYGLALHPKLQQDVAPFRDSTQTALFTATLAALGNNSLTNLDLLPRRFEIGNRQAVDLSPTNVLVGSGTNSWLYPETLQQAHHKRLHRDPRIFAWCVVIGAVAVVLCFFWKPMRNLTLGVIQFDPKIAPASRRLLRLRALVFLLFTIVVAIAAWRFADLIREQTYIRNDGEMFNLGSGTSAWPAEIVRFAVLVMGIWFCIDLYFNKQRIYLSLTRKFRFSTQPLDRCAENARVSESSDDPGTPVDVQALWRQYGAGRDWYSQLIWIGLLLAVYYFVSQQLFSLFNRGASSPVRGQIASELNLWLTRLAIYGFLALTFSTIDAVMRCSAFVSAIGAEASTYPTEVTDYFASQRGNVSKDLLNDWIDVRFTAALTERVGRFVYYPCWLILLLWLARSNWFDAWKWSPQLIIVYVFNFGLALASIFILQRAAKDARRNAIERLTAKVKNSQAALKTPAEMDADEGAKLLEEIRDLKEGAFVPFWQSPAVGAFFLSSGSFTIVEFLSWFAGR